MTFVLRFRYRHYFSLGNATSLTSNGKAVKSVNHTKTISNTLTSSHPSSNKTHISRNLKPINPSIHPQFRQLTVQIRLNHHTTPSHTEIMSAPTNVLHLRAETKPLEHRSCLTPSTTKALIEAGYTVNVERDPQRIFDDEEFERVGANLVPTGSWVDAPKEHIIVGLKELEEKDCGSHPNS